MNTKRKLIKFGASTGFTVVLEFGNDTEMVEYRNKIENAGLQCETIADFNLNFDEADLFMDMQSPECRAQFDIEERNYRLGVEKICQHPLNTLNLINI